GGASRFLLLPFLLARFPAVVKIAVLALDRFSAVGFVAIESFPLAPSAGGEKRTDQQAEDENQSDDDPLVGRNAIIGDTPRSYRGYSAQSNANVPILRKTNP